MQDGDIGSCVVAGVLAAHGGSGASTVARVLRLPEITAQTAIPGLVVVTGLTSGYGSRRVIDTVAAVGPAPDIVLCLTSTGWWTAPESRAMQRLLRDRATAIVVLPWCWRWHDSPPRAATATRAWKAAAGQLRTVVGDLLAESVTTPTPLTQGAHA